MKNKIFPIITLTIFSLLLTSCNVGKKATITQIETQSFLHFTATSEHQANQNWLLKVDQGNLIQIKVDKATSKFSKDDNLYSIPTGTHEIFIYKNEQLYLKKKIFIGNQETKTIKL